MNPTIIGQKVKKKNGKPFQSRLKVNTIKEIVVNSYTHLPAYSFNEDSSIVDQKQCEIIC